MKIDHQPYERLLKSYRDSQAITTVVNLEYLKNFARRSPIGSRGERGDCEGEDDERVRITHELCSILHSPPTQAKANAALRTDDYIERSMYCIQQALFLTVRCKQRNIIGRLVDPHIFIGPARHCCT